MLVSAFLPPDTTTLAPASSGRSLLVKLCSIHSDNPAEEDAETAFQTQKMEMVKRTQFGLVLHVGISRCLELSATFFSGGTASFHCSWLKRCSSDGEDLNFLITLDGAESVACEPGKQQQTTQDQDYFNEKINNLSICQNVIA